MVRARAALIAGRPRLASLAMPSPAETPRRDLTTAAIPALFAAALAGFGALALVAINRGPEPAATAIPNCILGDNAAAVGGPIDLLDHNGARVTQADFAGEPVVVYFGFARCPDACPISMNLLSQALVAPGARDLRTALITVDPARDTPAVMRDYVMTSGFPPGLIGLTGSLAQIEAAKAAFDVRAARSSNDPQSYTIDHTSFFYVLDSQWRTVAIFPSVRRSDPQDPQSPLVGAPVEDVAACIEAGLGGGD